MTTLLTLYNVTDAELRAVEAMIISQYDPAQLWNIPVTSTPFFCEQWRHSIKVDGKLKQTNFSPTKKRTFEQAKRAAQKSYESSGNRGSILLVQRWQSHIIIDGGRISKYVPINRDQTKEVAYNIAKQWLDGMIEKRNTFIKATAELVIQRSKDLYDSVSSSTS